MPKSIGVDLGTNSIGLSVRDSDKGGQLEDQLIYFRSVIFPSGVGSGQSGEFSYAAQRTQKRTTRNCLWARKQRIWATLRVLIAHGFCPLSVEGLRQWSVYDKSKGLYRKYPTNEPNFEQWVRLDFNLDGKPDYNNPFDIRKELTERKFDLSNQIERYIFGRAIYHIAQHRGFRSSKGETLQEMSKEQSLDNDLDIIGELKKSEENRSKKITEYMEENNLQTVGQAYSKLISEGVRIRKSEFNAVRSQFKQELIYIFKYQGLDINSEFCKAIISEKKNEGTIFYKRPLRSQKGAVGKCVFEKDKSRCPISHPEFEKFRALSFINNIKYRETPDDEWQSLTPELKQKMLNEQFLRQTRKYVKFEVLKNWLSNNLPTNLELIYEKKGKGTINYSDNTSISGCPVTARLIALLGENWETHVIETSHERVKYNDNKEVISTHKVTYNYEDIWHLCFMLSTSDEPEKLEEIAKNTLGFNDDEVAKLKRLYNNIMQGYAKISLKALRNINSFLSKGFIYSHAVLLAKLPSIFGKRWQEVSNTVASRISELLQEHSEKAIIIDITNNLISKYKQLTCSQRFGYKNSSYVLDSEDYKDIELAISNSIGSERFNNFDTDKQTRIRSKVIESYQEFFRKNSSYLKTPQLIDFIAEKLAEEFSLNKNELKSQLYHPSMIEFYPESKNGQLASPVIDAIRNPMAMRVLHNLRREINSLLKKGIIDSDTRVIVETAREFNDANWRWAINQYNDIREEENKEFLKILQQYYPELSITKTDIDKTRMLLEQSKEYCDSYHDGQLNIKKLINKYRLWLEQKCMSIYTGRVIGISSLLNGDYDIEHTIPRSKSFDDSLANMTICEADFNRDYKKNKMPSELSGVVYKGINVSNTIAEMIKPWQDRVARLKESIEAYAQKSAFAQNKDNKDYYIRQRHLLELECEYWVKKVNTFTKTEYTEGFRNNQLNDTRTISKYAFHYFKSVFRDVSVQRGETTALFRKILGIQNVYEKKDRNLHSHHAIDATVLTLIPRDDSRKALVELFYRKEEARELNDNITYYESVLNEKIEECNIPSCNNIVSFIENNIIVNHVAKDQTLTPSHRRIRRRGKVVKDKNGKPLWRTGDSIRGQLHKDSFYGVVRLPNYDKDNKPITNDGVFVYDNNNCEQVVIRRPIESILESKDYKSIIDPTLRETLINTIESRVHSGMSQSDAISKPIWMSGKKNKASNNDGVTEIVEGVHFDRNGRPIAPIRHVRCRAKSGAGYISPQTAIKLKYQTYKSDKPLKHLSDRNHKEMYRVMTDENNLCLLFEGERLGKIKREFVLITNLELAQYGFRSNSDIIEYALKIAQEKQLRFKAIIRKTTKVLIWDKTPEELYDCDKDVLNKHLYVVYKYNKPGSIYVYLFNHLVSNYGDFKAIKTFKQDEFIPHLMLVAKNFNCLIEGVDFDIDSVGNIIFRNR